MENILLWIAGFVALFLLAGLACTLIFRMSWKEYIKTVWDISHFW